MVEITLKRHGHQSKFEFPRTPHMTYVVFSRIYRQFPSNRNHLQCHNINIYGYSWEKNKKHQSKYSNIDQFVFLSLCKNYHLIVHISQKKFYGTFRHVLDTFSTHFIRVCPGHSTIHHVFLNLKPFFGCFVLNPEF